MIVTIAQICTCFHSLYLYCVLFVPLYDSFSSTVTAVPCHVAVRLSPLDPFLVDLA